MMSIDTSKLAAGARALLLALGATLLFASSGPAQEPPIPVQVHEAVEGPQAQESGGQEEAGEGTQEGERQTMLTGALNDLTAPMTDAEEEALRLVDEILREQQVLLRGQSFVYQSGGRRDPFRSLLLLRQRELAAPEDRPVGLPGFLVNEVRIKAVARYQGRWQAMIVGLDQRTYFAGVGARLYDARIVEITDTEVVFEQEVEDILGARSARTVIKRLRNETQE